MRKAPFPALVLIMAGCAPKLPPPPDEAMAARSGVRVETLRRGHSVYLAHCGRCHEHIMPEDVSRADWHVVVPGMAWNAGISAEDERALTSWILAEKER